MRMHSVGPEIWGETLKNVEKETLKLLDLKHGKKNVENDAHCTTWNMAKNLMNLEKEICTLYDIEYGKKY